MKRRGTPIDLIKALKSMASRDKRRFNTVRKVKSTEVKAPVSAPVTKPTIVTPTPQAPVVQQSVKPKPEVIQEPVNIVITEEDFMPTPGIVSVLPGVDDTAAKAAAAQNSNIIEAALMASGSVNLPNGTIYVNRTMKTSSRVGCGRINADSSFGYKVNGHPTMTGGMCRIVMLGATPTPVFRIRGDGFFSEDPLEIVGNGGVGMEIEGHVNPPTGRHRFANICFTTCSFAFDALGGYYDDSNVFHGDQNHADNSQVRGCETFCCQGLFRSDNEQAVNWVFRDCMVNGEGPGTPFTVCHIKRGGCVHLDRLVIEESQCTLFEVEQFSPNNCRLVCNDFFYDRMVSPSAYLRVLKYSGDSVAAGWSKWFLKVNGFMAQYQDPAKLYSIPANLPKDYFEVDIKDLYTS